VSHTPIVDSWIERVDYSDILVSFFLQLFNDPVRDLLDECPGNSPAKEADGCVADEPHPYLRDQFVGRIAINQSFRYDIYAGFGVKYPFQCCSDCCTLIYNGHLPNSSVNFQPYP